MKFHIVTLMPELVESALSFGVVGRARKKNLFEVTTLNPRQFTEDVHQTVDDRPFGGGDGMLMLAEPLARALESLPSGGRRILLSPQGRVFDQEMAKSWVGDGHVTLLCARYGGVDQRLVVECGLEEVSLGDFVLSGGELAACAMVDTTVRLLPGVLGHECSAEQDSFSNGLLETPHFTRPRSWRGLEVPDILLSGDHQKVGQWQEGLAWLVTLMKRPDLLAGREVPWHKLEALLARLTPEECKALGWDVKQLTAQLKAQKTP